jgi:hypothetical protein
MAGREQDYMRLIGRDAGRSSLFNLRSANMAYGVVHRFAGGTEDQYRASIAAVHPSDGSLPDGQLLHVAGATDDGWMIVAVHDSRESWERFRDGILMPRMEEGIEGGFQAPPEETTFEPAIWVEEVSSGNKPIEGVATSVAAFVGLAPGGPLNK